MCGYHAAFASTSEPLEEVNNGTSWNLQAKLLENG